MVKTEFKNVIQLLDYFKGEATCKALLAQQRWGGNPICPHCGAEKPYITARGYKCSNNQCYKKFSVTVGTIFENSKIKLRYWFAAIYLCSAHKKGISSHQLGRDLGITQKSAWFVLHRIREMLKDKAPQMLTGTVEVDETFIGGKEGNKHKSKRAEGNSAKGGAGKAAVIGLLERGGNIVTQPVKRANKIHLLPVMVAHVPAGTTVYTDEKATYKNNLKKVYDHDYTNHAKKQYVKRIGGNSIHTNSVEGFWSHLKRGLNGIYHSVSVKHLGTYCNEYAYRFNTRKTKDVDRFFNTLKNSGNFKLSYKQLIDKRNG